MKGHDTSGTVRPPPPSGAVGAQRRLWEHFSTLLSPGLAWTLVLIGATWLQGYIPEWCPGWFVSETGQITVDPFGSLMLPASIGLLLGWRWMWYGVLISYGMAAVGYVPIVLGLLDPTSVYHNEYAFGWSLLIGLHALGLVALFAPSLRARFSADVRDEE